MNEQKDSQKNVVNSYGQEREMSTGLIVHKPIYEFANKKTEKLVTALYMITDCMEADDALKAKLRTLGVALLSDMYTLAILSPVEKHTHITQSLARIGEITAFVDLAVHQVGLDHAKRRELVSFLRTHSSCHVGDYRVH